MAQIGIMENFDLGKYSVGFRHEVITDFSRNYGDSFRPVQLFIWYPSEEQSGKALNYTDYFLLNSTGQRHNKSDIDSLLRKEITSLDIPGKLETILSDYKKLRTIAEEQISMANESFPLVLFAPGGNTSGQLHSALCEYLASHGNIVLCLSSLGNADSLRWPFDQRGLNLQIEDMSFAINYMANSMHNLLIDKIC